MSSSIHSLMQSTQEIREEMKLSFENTFDTVDLTVIGPFTDESKKSIGIMF